ncbi:MAG TPA: hypothetical protein VH084_21245 [Mycobacterium sp.]|jgi:hypothetical protein|nr:hypothetical protein [Mycobacterium sp.]
MGHQEAAPSYQELLHTFKDALNRVLTGAVLPPTCAILDIALTLSLLDIAHAVRQGRQTQSLVARACEAFSVYAAGEEEARRLGVAPQSKSVTLARPAP